MPESWVEKEGEHCVLQRDYMATELSVEEGETVTVENGGGWATKESGQSRWVPLEYLVRRESYVDDVSGFSGA